MEQIISNSKYFVTPINSSKANKFTCYYHYSHIGFKKAKLNLGVFNKNTQKLVGVMQWGCSAQEAIRLDRYVKNLIYKEEYYELNRFCMADEEEKNSESQAISLGIKWIKKFQPYIRLLVSYAGRKEGNYGFIYQATNWEYLGYFISSGFWQLDGQEIHQITVWYRYCHSKYANFPLKEALKKMYNSVIQTWSKQFIYIQRLDKNLVTASPILPYPKPANFKIIDRIEVYKNEPYDKQNKSLIKPNYYYEVDELLFTRRKLIQDGVLKPNEKTIVVAAYDLFGHLIETRINLNSYEPNYKSSSIKHSALKNKIYKDRIFKLFSMEEEIPEEINTPIIAIIDEIPFPSIAEIGRYCNVSRQAASQAHNRKANKINGHDITWIN